MHFDRSFPASQHMPVLYLGLSRLVLWSPPLDSRTVASRLQRVHTSPDEYPEPFRGAVRTPSVACRRWSPNHASGITTLGHVSQKPPTLSHSQDSGGSTRVMTCRSGQSRVPATRRRGAWHSTGPGQGTRHHQTRPRLNGGGSSFVG